MGTDSGQAMVSAAVEETLCHDSAVEFVVIFGSRVDGTPRRSSDLDIAVKFIDELSADERFRKRCRFSVRLQSPESPFVDLSDIDELSLEFAHAVAEGKLLCGDEDAFEEFKDDVGTAFEQQHADVERRQREYIRRIAEDGLRG